MASKRGRTGGGESPSNKKTKDKSGEVSICVKCSKNAEEDSIECESCLKWEHRACVCAGISKESMKFSIIYLPALCFLLCLQTQS